jgi:hypothetical protein
VAPLELTGPYANALRLFELFRKESNFDAARQCIDICERLLAEHASETNPHPIAARSDANSDASEWVLYPKRHHILIHLARILQERYEFSGNQSDHIMAMGYAQEALDLCSNNDTVYPTIMVIYARILGVHAGETSKLEDIHRAISMCRGVMPLLRTTDHSLIISARVTLADIIHYLYHHTGNAEELDESIGLFRMICSEIRSSETDRYSDLYPKVLNRLGWLLHFRYERLQNISDLEEGISSCREALQLCPSIHLDRLSILACTMFLLYVGYYRFGTHQKLDEALDLGQQARHIAHFQSFRRRGGLLNAIASLLAARYEASQPSVHSANDMKKS